LITLILADPADTVSDARIVAVRRLKFTRVVPRSTSFHDTFESLLKPMPLTVSRKPGLPAVAEKGLTLPMNGCGFWITTVNAPDCVPDVMLTTSTLAVPVLATSCAKIVALNWVLLSKVVLRSELFHRIRESAANPLPVKVIVKVGLPAGAWGGSMLVMARVTGGRIDNGFEFEVPGGSPQKLPVTLSATC
jgi:hypothetical protein